MKSNRRRHKKQRPARRVAAGGKNKHTGASPDGKLAQGTTRWLQYLAAAGVRLVNAVADTENAGTGLVATEDERMVFAIDIYDYKTQEPIPWQHVLDNFDKWGGSMEEDVGIHLRCCPQSGTFYHFTHVVHMPGILNHGIVRGDVVVGPDTGIEAPWLTSEPDRDKQHWNTNPERWDKAAVRITVEIPPDARETLAYWPILAANEGLEPDWFNALNTGGGFESWYVYEGVIPTEWFTDIDYAPDLEVAMRAPHGSYGSASAPLKGDPTAMGWLGTQESPWASKNALIAAVAADGHEPARHPTRILRGNRESDWPKG